MVSRMGTSVQLMHDIYQVKLAEDGLIQTP